MVTDQYKDIITPEKALRYQLFWDVYKCRVANEIEELEKFIKSGDVFGFINNNSGEDTLIEETDNIMEYDPETVNKAIVEADSSQLEMLKKYPHRLTNLIQGYDSVKDMTTDELFNASESIVDLVFNQIREVNTVPQIQIDLSDEMKDLNALFNTRSVYDKSKKRFGLGNAGLQFLEQFFPNLNDVKKKGLKHTIRSAFFDDRHMRTTLVKALKYNLKTSRVFYRWLRISGVGYCSNFKPVVSKSIYEEFGGASTGVKVYDFAAGYAGRLLGAYAANNVSEYVGVDVNTETVKYHQELIEYLQNNYPTDKKIQTLLCGSEDFGIRKHTEYKNYFDIAFSSPQYFECEIYSMEETQSCHKFPQYDSWLKGFYIPTSLNALDALKLDGTFGMNIFEKLPALKSVCKAICASKGFFLVADTVMTLRTMPGAVGVGKKRDLNTLANGEPIWFFRHFESLYKDGHINEEQRERFRSAMIKSRQNNIEFLQYHYGENLELEPTHHIGDDIV